MHNRGVRFGRWQPLDDAVAPAGPGVLQARLDEGAAGLIDYPRGRSAMVYYDAADALADALARLRARAPAADRARVRVRFAEERDPAAALARLRDDFAARFGAPPRWS